MLKQGLERDVRMRSRGGMERKAGGFKMVQVAYWLNWIKNAGALYFVCYFCVFLCFFRAYVAYAATCSLVFIVVIVLNRDLIPLGITGRSGERDFIAINRLPQHPASNLSTIK